MFQGKPVDGFTGALPEGKIKEFLDKHLPEGDVLEAEVTSVEVNDAPPADDPDTVREALHQAMLQAPQDESARFDYIKLLLQEGKTDDAKVAFAPVIAQTSIVRRYDSLQRWMNAIDFAATHADAAGAVAEFDAKIAANKRDFDARFARAQVLISREALDRRHGRVARHFDARQDLERRTRPQDLHRHSGHHRAAQSESGRRPDPARGPHGGHLPPPPEQRGAELINADQVIQ